ncbi:hypothetical protein PTKU46_86610 [Paraburkholderia terrae]
MIYPSPASIAKARIAHGFRAALPIRPVAARYGTTRFPQVPVTDPLLKVAMHGLQKANQTVAGSALGDYDNTVYTVYKKPHLPGLECL